MRPPQCRAKGVVMAAKLCSGEGVAQGTAVEAVYMGGTFVQC